jgi:hypothetical protein
MADRASLTADRVRLTRSSNSIGTIGSQFAFMIHLLLAPGVARALFGDTHSTGKRGRGAGEVSGRTDDEPTFAKSRRPERNEV